MDSHTILQNVKDISAHFAQERHERQRRRTLAQSDFDQLREAGFLLTAVPADQGGVWENAPHTMRAICEILRTLAHGDPSVALVASMHPLVILSGGWLTIPQAPPPYAQAWEEQRRLVFQTACDGHWWGTIQSEPGSGGDLAKTKAVARRGRAAGEYLLTGQKHFGSGSGITSFVITNAIPEGETQPDVFCMDMRGVPWDGSAGVTLAAEWDGHGMTATQSHAMTFTDFPATRIAWPGRVARQQASPPRPSGHPFTAVIVGVVETAIEVARHQLEHKRGAMRAYEQVEWARVEVEGWLIQQAYEGVLRATEEERNAVRDARLAKAAIAELAESVTRRICKIIGGGAYSRHSPFGFWLEDVRALGYLRPPWGLAFDEIFAGAWPRPE